MFYKSKRNVITNKILEELNKLHSILITKKNADMNNPIIDKISISLTASKVSAHTSNEIEGITVTDGQTKQQNNNAKILIENYNEVLNYIKESFSFIKLNNNELLGWHKHLFQNTLQDESTGGKFKTNDNQVKDEKGNILIHGAAPWETPILINELNEWFNNDNETPSLIKCCIYIFDFLSIHPFNDGNGRTSRLLMNYLLLNNGYEVVKYISLEQIILQHKDEYLNSLKACNAGWNTDSNTYEPWILFVIKILIESLELFNTKLFIKDHITASKLNKKQTLAFIIDNTYKNKPFNLKDLLSQLSIFKISISEKMIHTTLKSLKDNDYLLSSGFTNKLTYTINSNKWDWNEIQELLARKD